MIKILTKIQSNAALRDGLFYALAGASSALVPLGLIPILTKVLTINEYGFYFLIISSIQIIVPFIGFGASNAVLVRYFTLCPKKFTIYLSSVFRIVVFSGAIFLVFIIIFYKYIDDLFLPGYFYLLFSVLMSLIFSVSLLFTSLYVVSNNSFGYLRVYIVYGFSLFLFTIIFCVVLELGLIGACLGIACSYFTFIISAYKGSQVVKICNSWSTIDARDALLFGYPLMVHSAAVAFIAFSDRFALSIWVGTEDVAIYGVTSQLALISGYFFHSINKVLQPRIYSLLKTDNKLQQSTAISYVYFYCVIVITISIIYALFFPFLISIMAGESYSVPRKVYYFLILGGAFNAMYLGFAHFVFFKGKTFRLSLITLVSAICYFGFFFFFAPTFGMTGVAFSFALTNGIMFLLTVLLARMCTDVNWLDRNLIKLWKLKFFT